MRTVNLFLVLFFLLSAYAFSQERTTNASLHFQGEHNYKRAKIYLDDDNNTLYDAKSLVIKDDSLSIVRKINYYTTSGYQDPTANLHINDVYMIKVSKGTNAALYAVLGGLTGGLAAILAFADAGSEVYTVDKEDYENLRWNMIIGSTIGGVIIGGIWGSTVHNWQTIYLKD